MYQTVVVPQSSKRFHVAAHSTYHTWHSRNSLQVDASINPQSLGHFVFIEASHEIEYSAQTSDRILS